MTSQENHDEWLITLLNSQIGKSDVVIHCGDFCFKSNYDYQANLLNRLNGNWTMIWGNHDSKDNLKRLKRDGVINDWAHYKEIKLGGQKACVMHFPIAAWNKQHYGSFMLHGHCVDGKTEILTTSGWKFIKDLSENEAVYSRNPITESLEIHNIVEKIEINYTGKVYSLNGKSVNFRVTEDHTFVGYDYKKEYIEKPFRLLSKSARYTVNVSEELGSQGIPLSKEMLQLYICIAADGSIKAETNLCRIRVKKEHKKIFLKKLFAALKLSFEYYEKEDYVSFNFYIPSELKEYNFKGLDDKLLSASKTQCEHIVEAYCNSDGHRQQNGVIIYSAKEKEIDLLHHLFVINGLMCTKYSRIHKNSFSKKEQHQLSVTVNKFQGFRAKHLVEEQVVCEPFYCVRVTNSNFITRRNGRVHITGNCHGSYTGKGKILDVGLDNSYNIFGQHKVFTEEEICDIMASKEIFIAEDHRSDKSKE